MLTLPPNEPVPVAMKLFVPKLPVLAFPVTVNVPILAIPVVLILAPMMFPVAVTTLAVI